jgi:acyl-coenzyme A thioesterase PaaI-like protein
MHHRFVHGAVIGFLADSACAWAAASLVGDVVTSEYKLNLMVPATGSRLLGRGEVITINGRQVICRADVFCEKDNREIMVATALATIVRLKM